MKAVRAIAAVCLTVGLVNACVQIDPEPNTPRVSNLTGEPVTLSIERDGVTTPLSTIDGGITIDLNAFNGTCTDGTLVAIGPGGEEVDRRTEPLCPEGLVNWSVASVGSPGFEHAGSPADRLHAPDRRE